MHSGAQSESERVLLAGEHASAGDIGGLHNRDFRVASRRPSRTVPAALSVRVRYRNQRRCHQGSRFGLLSEAASWWPLSSVAVSEDAIVAFPFRWRAVAAQSRKAKPVIKSFRGADTNLPAQKSACGPFAGWRSTPKMSFYRRRSEAVGTRSDRREWILIRPGLRGQHAAGWHQESKKATQRVTVTYCNRSFLGTAIPTKRFSCSGLIA